MNIILSTGILICAGFIFGQIANKLNLPKITGYIIAGILLNPDLFGVIPRQFVENTDALLTIALSLITFSIGGSLTFEKIKSTGSKMLGLMLFESLSAFLLVFAFVFLSLYFFFPVFDSINIILAVSLVLASLAAPTDPSATLAVIHEYKANGKVSSAMLEIAAFDDVAGIIIYTLATGFGLLLLDPSSVAFPELLAGLGKEIGGALLLGAIVGLAFNCIIKFFRKQKEGSLIVITFGMVMLCYGVSEMLEFESLLATMALGVFVINKNPLSREILNLIERYTDQLIFVIFFTLSGLHLQLSSLQGSLAVIIIYILARMLGKFLGVYTGSTILDAGKEVKRYAAGGLIPQGGIVIGLALVLTQKPAFSEWTSTIIGIIIGAALVHEIIGPVFSRLSLRKAGEIGS